MDRKGAWIIAGGLVLAALVLALAQRSAPRDNRTEPGTSGGAPGRYQVVRSSGEVIILLDTVTGDLYNAVPSNSARPPGGKPEDVKRPRTDKDEGPIEDKDR